MFFASVRIPIGDPPTQLAEPWRGLAGYRLLSEEELYWCSEQDTVLSLMNQIEARQGISQYFMAMDTMSGQRGEDYVMTLRYETTLGSVLRLNTTFVAFHVAEHVVPVNHRHAAAA